MRPFRLRVMTAIAFTILMLGSLASVANAGGEIPSRLFPEDPWDVAAPASSFPEDPWGVPSRFPEDPWGFSN